MPTSRPTEPGIKVTAIVVTYNPDLDVLKQLLQTLTTDADSVVVVDNHSAERDLIGELSADVKHYLLPSNLGLGQAHNLGIEYAKSINSTHVLLLDQDSLPDPKMLNELSHCAQQLDETQVQYSGIGCRYTLQADDAQASSFVRFSWFRFSRISCDTQPIVKADFLISSGTLIPLKALEKVGLMDESLFIDHIDTEWFLRASKCGYQAYGCCTAFMNHSLGDKTTKIWFLRPRLVPYHSPFRYYYIFRNSLLLYQRRYMPGKWILADCVRLLQNFIYFGVLSGQRKSNLKMMWRGCVDGLKGVSGRRDDLIFRDGR